MADALTLRQAYKGSPIRWLESLNVFARTYGQERMGQVLLPFLLCAFVIAMSLLWGGGTRGGLLSDTILQLVSLPLLLWSIWTILDVRRTRQMRIALLFCLVLALIPLMQLIPLPPWLWTRLPGREILVETFEILGQAPPWMPISVNPQQTWLSGFSLLPPVAIFLAVLQMSYRDRRWLTWVFLTIGIVSVFIGMMQVAQGPTSALRFFEHTNETEAVGFFANRNHYAALLYSLIVFAVAWAISAALLGQRGEQQQFDTLFVIALIGAFLLLVVLLAGQLMARSRMGLLLTIVALLCAFFLALRDRRVGSQATVVRVIFGSVALVVIFAVQFALYRVMERFAADPLADARLPFSHNTIEAALAYLPFGSGLGTFTQVYPLFERPADIIANTYANHAHNDFLELWLTTGLLGLCLAGMFLVWFGQRAYEIWHRSPPDGAGELDWDLARAAVVVVGLLVVHSLVDYPLRTGGIMAMMAFACALMIEPPFEKRSNHKSSFVRAGAPNAQMALQPDVAPQAKAALTKKTALPDTPPPIPQQAPALPSAEPRTQPRTQHTQRMEAGVEPMSSTKAPPSGAPTLGPVPAVRTPGSQQTLGELGRSTPSIAEEPPRGGTLAVDQRWGSDIEWPDQWSNNRDAVTRGSAADKSNLEKPPKDGD